MAPSITVDNRTVNYVVRRGTSRRYTYFRIRPDLTLEVVLPRGGKADPEKAIKSRINWISNEYQRVTSARRVLEEGRVMFAGSYLDIALSPDTREGLVPEPERGRVIVRTMDRLAVKELIRRWFLREASSYVVSAVTKLAPILDVKPTRVDVREIGKWGYCTRGGRLSFSWQLAALSDRLKEYVVLHELTHLRAFNHSREFKRILSRACPDFRQRELELDKVIPYSKLTLS